MELTSNTALIGQAGVYHVMSELSIRGVRVERSGRAVVAATLEGGREVELQVRTTKNPSMDFFPLADDYADWTGTNRYYVFLRYQPGERRFDEFAVSADEVKLAVEHMTRESMERGNKDWAPCWPLPRDDERISELKQRWLSFGAGAQMEAS